jgi:hypothetical protein
VGNGPDVPGEWDSSGPSEPPAQLLRRAISHVESLLNRLENPTDQPTPEVAAPRIDPPRPDEPTVVDPTAAERPFAAEAVAPAVAVRRSRSSSSGCASAGYAMAVPKRLPTP